LLASEGWGVSETAEELCIWRKTADHRRRRWLAAEAAMPLHRLVLLRRLVRRAAARSKSVRAARIAAASDPHSME
jgi:hypothetical protein